MKAMWIIAIFFLSSTAGFSQTFDENLKTFSSLNSSSARCQVDGAPQVEAQKSIDLKSPYLCLKSFLKYTGVPTNVPWGLNGPVVMMAEPEEEVVVYAMSGGVKKKITLFSSADTNLSSDKSEILTALRGAKFQMTSPQSTESVLSKTQYDWIRSQNLSIGEIVTVKINFKNRNFILDQERLRLMTMPDVNVGGAPVFKIEIDGNYSYVKPDEMGFLLSRAWDQDKNPIDVGIKPRQPQVSTSAGPFNQSLFNETAKKLTGYLKVNGEPVVKAVSAKPEELGSALKELNRVLRMAAENLFYNTRDSGLNGDGLKKQAKEYLDLLNSDVCSNPGVSQDSLKETRENLSDLIK